VSRFYRYYGLNRNMCEVLDEIRALDKSKNYSSLMSLVDEIQSMANRMEAKLNDIKDFNYMKEEKTKLKKQIKKLKEKLEELEGNKED